MSDENQLASDDEDQKSCGSSCETGTGSPQARQDGVDSNSSDEYDTDVEVELHRPSTAGAWNRIVYLLLYDFSHQGTKLYKIF